MEAEETMECLQEFPEHHKMILDRLNEQREQDRFTDITLIVDGHHFKAHKAVLAACSKFFYKFFQEFTQEPLVEIEGVSKMAFRHLIEFTYTAKLMIQGEEEANDVWKAAEFLQMLEAIKALEVRNKENSAPLEENATGKSEAKKRKIAETSNVITESLPSAESEPVEIEVEIAEGTIEVEDEGIETLEEVASAKQSIKYIQSTGSSDDSALALLADITSKYRQGDRKGQIKEEDGCASDPTSKQVEGIEIVELQLSHVKDLFHCEKCNRSFKLFYHFKEHMKSHSTESFKCEICNKRYLRESAWKQHLNCYHLEEGGVSKKQRTGKKIHICQYCEKQFDHFGHFKEHLRKHTGEKPFECPNCHERFARNSTLKCHLTACQTGVGAKKGRKKLYECQVCNSVFNSWDQFKDHLVIHTGDKPNHCTLCDLWFMQGNELRRHLSDTHNISERLVTEEVLSVETRVQTEPVTSMTIIEQVGKVHVLPLLQVQVDSAQVTVEQVHPDLLQDSQVHDSHISELPEQVQVSYLEVGRIQTEEGTEVHVEELHVERVNQMPIEVQTELLEADLDQVTPEIMNQEERDPSQADAAEAAREDHEDAEGLETKPTMDSQAEGSGNENRTPVPVLE
ncbi:zinc finger protein 131 isoform X1 [Diceros bicornis minor]|nr:PREDICTED: zinc finger protein 131 isoform X2 [Ceratotherium simum simum]XP_014637095.1 PREDICTED: zinc finger protein 131 isoform X2 [Ceratotherium simum simum]XP_014637096.1 PREDICTED: zinc finger protein 131 isoform X2 [Ceratotherium simum simum]XP_058420131.1 zinc finger protein 131 isoform X1 [Diceros bicornis minor]XP_058420132.1 zinc finger protein 131 isoform X1 [Diceros bicornis minor]XP_058420133.1 zinc finger protein 131 isoform X1 [Diceros bicornis minor]XP_058420134.1 zinc fin